MTLAQSIRASLATLLLATTSCATTPRTEHLATVSPGELDVAKVVAAAMNAFSAYYRAVYCPDTVPDSWKAYKLIRYIRGDGWAEVVLGPANPQLIGGGGRFRVQWGLVADLKQLYP
jgi:hypothetical protein